MRTFVVNEVENKHVTEKCKATRYVMSKELIDYYGKINDQVNKNVELMIQGKSYEIILHSDKFPFLVKNFIGEKIVLEFPPLNDNGTITHYQYNTVS